MSVIRSGRRTFADLSFRTRLIISNAILAVVVIVGIAYFTLARSAVTGDFLAAQLTKSVLEETEGELNSLASLYANDLDDFFDSMAISMETVKDTLQVLLATNSGGSSDITAQLTRLEQGSWDNPNTDVASIFVPISEEIPVMVLSEIDAARRIDFIAPGILSRNNQALAVYFGSALGETIYYPNIDLATLLPADFDVTQRPWFVVAGPQENAERGIVWSAPYQDAALHGLVVTCSAPVYDAGNTFRGVVAIDLQLAQITELVSSIRVGKTGYAFLIDRDGHVIAMPAKGYTDFGLADTQEFRDDPLSQTVLKTASVDMFTVLAKMTSEQSGLQTVTINGVEKYVAYRPVSAVSYSLGLVVPVSEMQGDVVATQLRMTSERSDTQANVFTGIAVGLILFLLASLWLGNALTAPLEQLTETANRIAEGDLNVSAKITSRDEIGVMANTFNVMTENLRGLIGALEARVAERTANLVEVNLRSEKRALQLKTVSEVTRILFGEANVETIFGLVTEKISEKFGYYHVGLFLLDGTSTFAVLQSANGLSGKRMLARGEQVQASDAGLVGTVISTAKAQIAAETPQPAGPELGESRSEIALPLALRGQMTGVLDIHSNQPASFTQDDVETLGILADQIAIAIENAQLLSESQQALAEVRSLYGEYIGHAWERKTTDSPLGYYLGAGGGRSLGAPADWEGIQFAGSNGKPALNSAQNNGEIAVVGAALAIPIKLHNQIIGVLNVRSPHSDRAWKADEIAVVEATADRLALALENARLFEETSGRAAREHAVAEITSKIRQTNDPQAMIRTAIEELQRALGVKRVEIVPQVASAFLAGRERESGQSDKEQT